MPRLLTKEFLRGRTTPGLDGCWNWVGSTSRGYGTVKGREGKTEYVHRLMYRFEYGVDLSSSDCILHSCHNPRCCNPKHLRIGSRADNMLDKVLAGRQSRGETNGMAKLTEALVRKIRRLSAQGHTQKAIAEVCGVSPSNVSYVVSGKTWRHTLPTSE